MRLPWEYHEKVFDDKKVIEVTVSLDRNSLSLTIDRSVKMHAPTHRPLFFLINEKLTNQNE